MVNNQPRVNIKERNMVVKFMVFFNVHFPLNENKMSKIFLQFDINIPSLSEVTQLSRPLFYLIYSVYALNFGILLEALNNLSPV